MTSSDDTSPEALGRRHWAEIKAWALYECGDLSTADDVCQEAWMKLRASRTALDPTRNPLAWLRTVVRSTARDLLARESRMRRPAPVERSTTPDLDRVIDLHRGAREALDAFVALSPRQREAVDLVDRQGLTVAEAADRMEVEPGTVRVLVHQARKALRARLIDTELPALVRSR